MTASHLAAVSTAPSGRPTRLARSRFSAALVLDSAGAEGVAESGRRHARPPALRRRSAGHYPHHRSTVINTPMTTRRTTTYEFRVAGHLDDHWGSWLDGLVLARRDDGTTVLTGPLADQSELHGLISRIRDPGAPLLSLRAVDDPAPGGESAAPVAAMLRQSLRTERLTLRAATAHDADATWRYRRLDSVGAWLTEVPKDLETGQRSRSRSGSLPLCATHCLPNRVTEEPPLAIAMRSPGLWQPPSG
jgi:hypothetical protein